MCKNQPTPPVRRRSRRGFTLIELMVVILILGILVGLVVGVGRNVMIQVSRNRTKVIQDIVLQAIRAFREVREAAPIVDSNVDLTDAYKGNSGSQAAAARISSLYAQLASEPKSASFLQKLPPEAVYTPTQRFRGVTGVYKTLRDGFDYDMDYQVTGLGPVILSPGQDGRFGPPAAYDSDNIRSDGKGQ